MQTSLCPGPISLVLMGVSNVTTSSEWKARRHTFQTHPSPKDDPLILEVMDRNPNYIDFEGTFICGFNSLEQLRNWFSRTELSNLQKLGFIIAAYTPDEVVNGQTQVLFIPKGRRRITQIHEFL